MNKLFNVRCITYSEAPETHFPENNYYDQQYIHEENKSV